ncbi:MAG: hypothetical protein HKP27_13140 [Myxococcales bacterium]|nr:hypothetical protein [Myxococcales bacterium]
MELTQLAQLGEFIGGIAVLVTLIYLAVQVGGSKKALKTQTHHNLLSIAQRPYELLVADDELASIVERGNKDPVGLSPPQWIRYCAYTMMLINAWEYGFYLSRAGSTPPELWEGADAHFAAQAASHAGWRTYWEENSHTFAEPFHSYAENHFPGRAV